MIIELCTNAIVIRREVSDPKYRTDSRFLYHVKKELNRRFGMDLIKKLACKDGHLVSDFMHYLRDRKWNWCAWDSQYAIRQACTVFNDGDEVRLDIQRWDNP